VEEHEQGTSDVRKTSLFSILHSLNDDALHTDDMTSDICTTNKHDNCVVCLPTEGTTE